MHLFIKRITLDTSKKIKAIELSFDENADSLFSGTLVSAAVGDFLRPKQAIKREIIEIAI